MIEQSSKNLYPLISRDEISYEDEKRHSMFVDEVLGFRTETVETAIRERRLKEFSLDTSRSVHRRQEFWIDKAVDVFSTPYTEFRTLLNELSLEPGDTVVDLGAGYGRMAFVIEKHYSGVRFIGYEILRERCEEGLRVFAGADLKNSKLICADVSKIDFAQLDAGFYFMYDFGSREDVEICLDNLKRAAKLRTLTIVARGGRSRAVIEKHHAWLSQVVSPVHRGHYSIYRSAE